MRILFWNLGYGRGHTGAWWEYLLRADRLVHLPIAVQERFVTEVAQLIERERPDVFACAEIATGDWWNRGFNLHEQLVRRLPQSYVEARASTKYGESVLNTVPFHRGNANAIISFTSGEVAEWHFAGSRKN